MKISTRLQTHAPWSMLVEALDTVARDASDLALLIRTESTGGCAKHPAATPLVSTRILFGILGSRPDLYRVVDRTRLSDAFFTVGGHGFAALLAIAEDGVDAVEAAVRDGRYRPPTPPLCESALPSILEGTAFLELATCLETVPVKGGEEESYLICRYAEGLPPELAAFAASIGSEVEQAERS